MAVSTRTRKLLWGRAANRCAICRSELTLLATASGDKEALVGEECHIIAQSAAGPRGALERNGIDDYQNLVLLCRVDHCRVDQQPMEYGPDRLRAIKAEHEAWVRATLGSRRPPSMRIVTREGQRTKVSMLTNGRQLLDIVDGACGYDFDADDLRDDHKTELVVAFLKELHDTGDILSELDSGDRIRIRSEWTRAIEELAEAGLLVYGGRSQLELECDGTRTPWPVALIRVLWIKSAIVAAKQSDARNSD